MTKQMTVTEKWNVALTEAKEKGVSIEVMDFLQERADLHDKQASRKKKSETKSQKENKVFIEQLETFFFEDADPEIAYTSQEVAQALEFDFTPQKMTALLKKVENAERVEKSTNDPKKVGYKAK